MSVSRRKVFQSAFQFTGGLLVLVARPVMAIEVPDLGEMLASHFPGETFLFDDQIAVTLPPLAENGNSVAFGVDVVSPMTDANHVTSIDIFAPANPNPHIASFFLNPRSGRASVSTRIRLAGSQPVAAVARMSDRALHVHTAEIVVTEAACLDFLF